MTDKNQVIITPNSFFGYIDDSTACGRAKAKQVKADMETLATMLQDTNLSPATKKAIYTDYAKAIREYVERKETCCDCNCDCEREEEDEYEEEYEEEEYAEEPTIDDMERYSIYFGESEEIDCDSYAETIEKVGLLLQLGIEPEVYGYDNDSGAYRLDILATSEGIMLEMA